MAYTRRTLLGTVATSATFAFAGCLGDGDGGGDGNDGTDGSDGDGGGGGDDGGGGATTTETTAGGDGATVQVAEHPEYGEMLVDADGMTLYVFDNDEAGSGASSCSGSCADAWPPLTTDGNPTAGDGVTAELSTFERGGGESQVSADGWPLYSFASDESPGDAKGQGVADAWWVLRPDGTPVRSAGSATVQVSEHPDFGEILVDADGMTLYMFDNDEAGSGASSCSGSCADAWPPLTVDDGATAGDGVTAELSTFERSDGETQVSAGGWPLYYFASDESPGDAKGQAVGDAWWVLRPDGSPVRSSSETTTTTTDDGGVY